MLTTLYNYHPDTFAFISTSQPEPNPRNPFEPIVPAHSTVKPVPQNVPPGMIAVFDPGADDWTVLPAEVEKPLIPDLSAMSLEQAKVLAEGVIDAHFSRLYRRAEPDPAVWDHYRSAYDAARAWLASLHSDLPLVAPQWIEALAAAMRTSEVGVTPEQAAQFMVAKWDEAKRVFDQGAAARLRAKAAVRDAASPGEVAKALGAGTAAMGAVSLAAVRTGADAEQHPDIGHGGSVAQY